MNAEVDAEMKAVLRNKLKLIDGAVMRDGFITFSDLVGRLKVLRVDCDRCGRHGRYLVDKSVYDHGPEAKLTEWFSRVTSDCPEKNQEGVVRACDAIMPDLRRLRHL